MKEYKKCKDCGYHTYVNGEHLCREEPVYVKILNEDFENDVIMSCCKNEITKYINKYKSENL